MKLLGADVPRLVVGGTCLYWATSMASGSCINQDGNNVVFKLTEVSVNTVCWKSGSTTP
jgi:hypothetical protein